MCPPLSRPPPPLPKPAPAALHPPGADAHEACRATALARLRPASCRNLSYADRLNLALEFLVCHAAALGEAAVPCAGSSRTGAVDCVRMLSDRQHATFNTFLVHIET